MKKFLFQFTLFSFLSGLLTVIVIIGLSYFVQKDGFYSVDPSVNYLLVGDSHAECAFNDQSIDHFINFGQSGESYFYTYLKTKKILENNPSIKVVFIEFNNGQIIENIDSIIWDKQHVSSKFPKYAFALDLADYSVLAQHNLSGLLNAQALTIISNASLLQKSQRTMHDLDWGNYKSLTNNGQVKLADLKNRKMVADSIQMPHSTVNLDYLLKLVEVCRSHNAKVVFVRSPVHEKYWGRLNEKTFQYLRKKHFSSIPFWDYQDYKIEDFEFADVHHLNFKGANKFSVFFNDEIRKNK